MVIVDTSVLVNFLLIDRIDLISHLTDDFAITSHVPDEISTHFPDLNQSLVKPLRNGSIAELTVADPSELFLFRGFVSTGRLGVGECSAIAAAIHRRCGLALDRTRAHQDALSSYPTLDIKGTVDMMLLTIEEGLVSIPECDSFKLLLENQHGIRFNTKSFAELLG